MLEPVLIKSFPGLAGVGQPLSDAFSLCEDNRLPGLPRHIWGLLETQNQDLYIAQELERMVIHTPFGVLRTACKEHSPKTIVCIRIDPHLVSFVRCTVHVMGAPGKWDCSRPGQRV